MLIDLLIFLFSIFILLFGISFLLGIFSAGPFIPTSNAVLSRFAAVAKLKKGQKIFELGCGDARLLRFIEKKYGIIGEGYEIAPLVYFWEKLMNRLKKSRTRIYFRSLFSANLRDADVIFLYIVPLVLDRLARKVKKECKPGTLIVSEGFQIKGLELLRKIPNKGQANFPSFYLYQV